MVIQHNLPAMNSYRNLTVNQNSIAGNLEKLSSGYQINRAGDNAAGLAISEKMRCEITGLNAAQKNVADGISLIKTAEGAMEEVHSMLNRMSELATLAANGTYADEDRQAYQNEIDELINEIDRIGESTNFNGIHLFDGSLRNNSGLNFNASGLNGVWNIGVTENWTTGEDRFQYSFESEITLQDGSFFSAYRVDGDITVRIVVDSEKSEGNLSIKESELGETTIYVSSDEMLQTDGAGIMSTVLAQLGFQEGPLGDGIPFLATKYNAETGTTSMQVSYALDEDKQYTNGLMLQIGSTNEDYNQLRIFLERTNSTSLGVSVVDVSSLDMAQLSMDPISNAVNAVSRIRAQLGAYQNRLEHAGQVLSIQEENIQDAESTIRDTDVAKEMMEYTKNNILIQSSQSMLAQANQLPQGVLQLVG